MAHAPPRPLDCRRIWSRGLAQTHARAHARTCTTPREVRPLHGPPTPRVRLADVERTIAPSPFLSPKKDRPQKAFFVRHIRFALPKRTFQNCRFFSPPKAPLSLARLGAVILSLLSHPSHVYRSALPGSRRHDESAKASVAAQRGRSHRAAARSVRAGGARRPSPFCLSAFSAAGVGHQPRGSAKSNRRRGNGPDAATQAPPDAHVAAAAAARPLAARASRDGDAIR